MALSCCGRPAANFAVVNRLSQLFQKTSVCCLCSQTGLLQEVLDVMVVAEKNEQVVWQGLLRQGWGIWLSLYGCDLCLRSLLLDTDVHYNLCIPAMQSLKRRVACSRSNMLCKLGRDTAAKFEHGVSESGTASFQRQLRGNKTNTQVVPDDEVVSCSVDGPGPGNQTSLQGDGASGLSNSPGGPQCHPVLCRTQIAAAAATQSAW